MKTPWHLWVIGVVTLLWNAGGAFDYLMTETRAQWYMDQFTPEQLDYFYGFPPWVVASWAVGVWFAVLGSVLLLVRSRHAVNAFLLSFLGMIGTTAYSYGISDIDPGDVMGPGAALFSLVIAVVAVLMILYSRALRLRGVLR